MIDNMLPDLESLRCFEAAATHLNFRAAANAVGLSPAAFSDRIRRLEESLGVRLFARTTRRVQLAPGGERLLSQARRALTEAQRCVDMVQEGSPAPFELTIGTRFELGMSWVLPAIADLERIRPEQKLHLYFSEGPAIMEGLLRGQIDAVIGSMRLASPRLTTVPLHEERYTFVASPDLLARHPLTEPGHADAHTLIDTNPSLPLFRYWQDQAPVDPPWQFRRHRYMGAIAAIRSRVLDGTGVGVLPEYFIRGDLESGRLVRVLTEVEPRTDWFRLVWREGHMRSADLEALGQFLRKRPLT